MTIKSVSRKTTAVVAVLMVGLCVSLLNAQDATKEKKKRGGKGQAAVGQRLMKGLEKASLTDEQKKQAQDIIKGYRGKLMEATKAVNGALTAEQKKTLQEAQKKGREAGLKGKELAKSITDALKLDEAAAATWTKNKEALSDLTKKVNTELRAFLTDEQKQLLRPAGAERKKKGKKADSK